MLITSVIFQRRSCAPSTQGRPSLLNTEPFSKKRGRECVKNVVIKEIPETNVRRIIV